MSALRVQSLVVKSENRLYTNARWNIILRDGLSSCLRLALDIADDLWRTLNPIKEIEKQNNNNERETSSKERVHENYITKRYRRRQQLKKLIKKNIFKNLSHRRNRKWDRQEDRHTERRMHGQTPRHSKWLVETREWKARNLYPYPDNVNDLEIC